MVLKRDCFYYSKEQEFLLVSARQEILRYNLVDPGAGLRPLPIPNLRMVIALDFDMKNNCIYWSDINEDNLGIKVSIKDFVFQDGRRHTNEESASEIIAVAGTMIDQSSL